MGQVGDKNVRDDDTPNTSTTRTSKNSWVERERTPIIDAVYRRSADLLRIDEALFRQRLSDEHPDRDFRGTLAESLQLVHYDPGQEVRKNEKKLPCFQQLVMMHAKSFF